MSLMPTTDRSSHNSTLEMDLMPTTDRSFLEGRDIIPIWQIQKLIELKEKDDDYDDDGVDILRTAAFQWIRGDSASSIASSLLDSGTNHSRDNYRTFETAITIETDEIKKLSMYTKIHDLQSEAGLSARSNGDHSRTVSLLGRAMKNKFYSWEVPHHRNFVTIDDIAMCVEQYILICISCSQTKRYTDALTHADTCTKHLSVTFPQYVQQLPNFAKLLAYQALLRVKIHEGAWNTAYDESSFALNIINSLELTESAEAVFVVDFFCRVLAMAPGLSQQNIEQITSYQCWVQEMWKSMDSHFQLASSIVFLTDFRIEHGLGIHGDDMDHTEFENAYVSAKRLFQQCESLSGDIRDCITRRMGMFRSLAISNAAENSSNTHSDQEAAQKADGVANTGDEEAQDDSTEAQNDGDEAPSDNDGNEAPNDNDGNEAPSDNDGNEAPCDNDGNDGVEQNDDDAGSNDNDAMSQDDAQNNDVEMEIDPEEIAKQELSLWRLLF